MRSCKSSMDSTTLRAAARALIMKKAAARPKTYISPYHRRAIGPSRIRMGSMSGFGNTRGHPTEVDDSFQVHPSHPCLDAGTGFRYIREAGQGVGEHGKGRVRPGGCSWMAETPAVRVGGDVGFQLVPIAGVVADLLAR